jgi:hypothetical protein
METVLGKLKDNSFILQQKQALELFKKNVSGIISTMKL